MKELQRLRLRAHEDRRIRAGHLWVYSNEVDTVATPLSAFEPGVLARLENARGAPLGLITVNGQALLCGRVLTSRVDAVIDAEWFERRLRAALAFREAVYAMPFYRLIYGEADGLPGLVVDRYGPVLVVQVATAGMEMLTPLLLRAVDRVLKPQGILLRNDAAIRETEGLPLYTTTIGNVPNTIEMEEGGVRFRVPLKGGQKTGWFFDQRDNRDRLVRYAGGARVLDVCSYIGAWGLRALRCGAVSVCCIDTSRLALEAAAASADLNKFPLDVRCGQALPMLECLASEGRRYDLVILDPPALIKRKKDRPAGIAHYRRLNRASLEVLNPGGILISCSCSFHLEMIELQHIVLHSARAAGRRLSIIEQGGQGPDHPVHPAIAETRYLKTLFCRLAPEPA